MSNVRADAPVEAGPERISAPFPNTSRSPVSRSYVWTINNPKLTPTELIGRLESDPKHRFSAFQLEIGESGTPHYQGYTEYTASVRWTHLKSIDPAIHLEKRKGTRVQAREYCQKEDTRASALSDAGLESVAPDDTPGPHEVGDFGAGGSGTRNDLELAASIAKETGSLKRVAEECPGIVIKYARGINELCRLYRPQRSRPPKVILMFGPTGVGKTRWAVNHHDSDDLYIKEPDQRWFDGYEQQEAVVFDDFAGAPSKLSVFQLLRILDRYPVNIEIKGSTRQLLATTIYVTTNYHPSKWYNWENRWESYGALARRIHQVVCYHGGLPYVANHEKFFAVANEGVNYQQEWTPDIIGDIQVDDAPLEDPDAQAPEFAPPVNVAPMFEPQPYDPYNQ